MITTSSLAEPAAETGGRRRGRIWRSRVWRWSPAALAVAFTVAVLVRFGVSPGETARFAAYVFLCLAFPGQLLIRASYRGSLTLAEEIALGVTLGYAVEIPAYVAARAVGAPLLVLAWPVATYAAFLAVPRLRPHWRRPARKPAPAAWSWFIGLMVVYLVGWGAFTFFRSTALTWPALAASHPDLQFHLALIGELRHHMPPTLPMVAGEPLLYHWFVYAHLAAASWITGVDPVVLLLRLAALPMLAAFVVIVGTIGRRVIGSWPGAALAVVGTIFVAIPSLYLNANGLLLWTGVQHTPWMSPSQTLGALVFAPVVLLLVDLLEGRGRAVRTWLLFAVLLLALMGAKATYLPLLVAGLSAVVAGDLVRRRRPRAPALTALAAAGACLAYAQFVLYGGASYATSVEPLSLMGPAWRDLTGSDGQAAPGAASVLGIASLHVLSWAATWCGALGLLSRPRALGRPGVVLMIGVGAGGLGAILALGSPTLNQGYFLQAAYPYLAILAAYGVFAVARRERTPRPAIWCAAAAGLAVAYTIRTACAVTVPLGPDEPESALYLPHLLLVAVAAAAALTVVALRRRLRAWTLVLVMMTAAAVPAAWQTRLQLLVDGTAASVAEDADEGPVTTPPGAMAAARWLRAHSEPDDLIATNEHCRWGGETPCDSRHFWVTALSERRVLVEGWAYTPANLARWRPGAPLLSSPFWDGERLRVNDAVFTSPSAASVERLRDRYGVAWLVADESRVPPGADIGAYATLRFRSGGYAVYRVPARPTDPHTTTART
ncbi:hypothetical protein Psi02_25340 [Planotetraspora silvatica]|uniref:4-amino-4-deoxy-L-arabinose transferase-like glycosyltransferase n=1 Tax=Planotetraspora silvatica TaxID=234614 RepID=A0A8J3UX53_9ACTN|nr:hypothetical protein [Planotetraspora silvatica]GII46110.1 hypothetical protein Psi02_25340 [Planotetraspora silvatica]